MIVSKEIIPIPVRRTIKRAYTGAKRVARRIRRSPEAAFELATELRAKASWHAPAEIAAYRKKIKVYDVFTFFNELDLLDIRLNILDPYVDYFVISEANVTFSGQPKPLYFKENRDRFAKWRHKIIYQSVEDVPRSVDDLKGRLDTKNMSPADRKLIEDCLASEFVDKDFHWLREFYIKESPRKALAGLADEDFCYVSDLDEIWNPELRIDYMKDDVFKLIQTAYVYYLNNRSDEDWHGWTGTIATKYKNIRATGLNLIRTHKRMYREYVFLRNGGWHFTFQGGPQGARRKIEESRHSFYKTDETLVSLDTMIHENRDYKGRDFKLWIDDSHLPAYLLENRATYERFFKKPLPPSGKMRRSTLINMLIERFGYRTYLEIGVNTPAQPGYNWDNVRIGVKHGVDPNPAVHATFPMPSDEFFARHAKTKYDLVFVDGLHVFDQAYRDIVNSLAWLSDNGTIVAHDCNPTSEITQRPERASHVWHGDVWKAILKLRMEEPDLSIWTVNTDEGCAIIRRGHQELFVPEAGADPYAYEYFDAHRKEILNMIEVAEFKKLLEAGL